LKPMKNYIMGRQARRIAAKIAKQPELLRNGG
jgi:hypothetical protein